MSHEDWSVVCPTPLRGTSVQMAHGGGGRRARELHERLFLPAFSNPMLAALHDSARLDLPTGRVAITTDSYVVEPRFFPGGDLGRLAICGTLNDLAMAGATPHALTAGFILEEGLPLEELHRIVHSMAHTAATAGVPIVAGDTKVVPRGRCDGVYLNTTGVGVVPDGVAISPAAVQPGDAVLLSGDIGRHGIAVLSARNGVGFETSIESDCASVVPLVKALMDVSMVHCLRDPTRGGLATVLNEIALDAHVGIEIEERSIGVPDGVRGACELLGLDPLYVACEGRFVAFVPEHAVDAGLRALHALPEGRHAQRIGTVHGNHPGRVVLKTTMGTRRVLDLLSGEQLPRIC